MNFDEIAMGELLREYPEEIKTFDALYVKEKAGSITGEGQIQLHLLDKQLRQEFERYKLHYIGNWAFLKTEQKQALMERIKEKKEVNG